MIDLVGSLDYVSFDEVYTFSLPNEQVKIDIPIINDVALEDDEEFFTIEFLFLNDSVPVSATGFQATVIIIDDDSTLTTFKKNSS